MEEKKKLETANADNQNPSYEDLKNYCDQLLTQRNQLAQKLQQVTTILNKLPWLFEVVKNREVFSPKFTEECITEIEEIMTPPKESPEDSKD